MGTIKGTIRGTFRFDVKFSSKALEKIQKVYDQLHEAEDKLYFWEGKV